MSSFPLCWYVHVNDQGVLLVQRAHKAPRKAWVQCCDPLCEVILTAVMDYEQALDTAHLLTQGANLYGHALSAATQGVVEGAQALLRQEPED